MEKYNEVPAHALQISTDKAIPLTMIIAENKNNPTSTVIMVNPNLDISCVFMTSKDTLRSTNAESLPAKMADEEAKLQI
jgi:hypothetical protein